MVWILRSTCCGTAPSTSTSAIAEPPGCVAAEVEGGDVDAGLAEQRAEAADEARLVLVGDVEHVGRELGFDVDALDLDDARLAVGEDRAGDARAPAAR